MATSTNGDGDGHGHAEGLDVLDVLDVGRRTRSVPPAIRRALDARDRGCRFPGCGLRFTAAHHVRHWADGGETKLSNLVLLCRHHHRLVHEEGWRVEMAEGAGHLGAKTPARPRFYDPRGALLPRIRPSLRIDGDPVEALNRHNRFRGSDADWKTAGARHRRSDDIPLEVLGDAIEALTVHAEREAGREAGSQAR